jgi:hypothetical protein
MIDQYIQQLQSPDPQQRRQAIIALGRSKDRVALKHLAQIFHNDPEPDLRDLAKRAGQHIRQAVNTIDPNPASSTTSPAPILPQPPHTPAASNPSVIHLIGEPEDEPSLDAVISPRVYEPLYPELAQEPPRESAYIPPIQGREYELSREDRERAKQYVEEALSMNMRGDNAKGMKLLAQGLAIDPNLMHDGYFMSIAASVTGLEGDGAIQMIMDSNQRASFVKTQEERKKQERIDKHLNTAQKSTWTSSGFEIVIFALISTIGPVLQLLVISETARATANSTSAMVQQVAGSLPEITIGLLVAVGVVSGITGVIGFLMQGALIHFAAVSLLGGHGTLRYMLEVLLGYYNKWLPIIFFVSFIAIAVAFISEFSPVALCVALPLVALSLYVSSKTSSKIGEAYDFGAVKGCLAYFISVLVLSVGTSVLFFIAGQTILRLLQGLIPQG